MPASKKWTKVEIHKSLIERMDGLVLNGLQPSRQSAINHFIRRGLEITETQMFYKELFDIIISRLDKIEECIDLIKLNQREGDKK